MKLDILSFSESLKYEPGRNSYAIRIFNSLDCIIEDLIESENWIEINSYYFDDGWPEEWKEYADYNTKQKEFRNYLYNKQKKYPKMTKESLKSYLESRGHPYGRERLFNENIAVKIMNDYEKVKDKVENIMISCIRGKNRSPALGIAMNEIYGWKIKELKEKFPEYRKYVYSTMILAAQKRK